MIVLRAVSSDIGPAGVLVSAGRTTGSQKKASSRRLMDHQDRQRSDDPTAEGILRKLRERDLSADTTSAARRMWPYVAVGAVAVAGAAVWAVARRKKR